jgi:hypothetical protein
MKFAAAPTDAPAREVRVFITGGPHITEYATAIEISEQGFITVRLDGGRGHVVVEQDDLRAA